jgi:hypothetical protein
MTDRDPATKVRGGHSFLLVTAALLALAASVWFALPRVMSSRIVIITMSANGVPHLSGVPLGNKTIRRCVFRVLGRGQAYVIVRGPRGGLEGTNRFQLQSELGAAGITGSIRVPSR